jgi:hypothetical protein
VIDAAVRGTDLRGLLRSGAVTVQGRRGAQGRARRRQYDERNNLWQNDFSNPKSWQNG